MNRRQFLSLLALLSASPLRSLRAQSTTVNGFVDQMTLRQKVGQLFMFSVDGSQFTEAMHELITTYHAGGMALFRYNVGDPTELTTLTNAMQSAALSTGVAIPLLIGADQEGGRVSRLQGVEYTAFPNPMALGAANDPALTYEIGQAIGEEMLVCGVNLNFAPVLDVNTRSDNPVINVRSFGADPIVVAEHGVAFMQGLQAAGVIATGKHFPGHGNTFTDSHFELPIVELDRETLLYEMTPFLECIQADIGCIMTAHILYMGLDNTPATFSAPIMTELLRQELSFGGVLLSDALTMGAVAQARENPIYALRDALLAGVDVLAYGAKPNGSAPTLVEQIELFELVVRLVETGLVTETRLDQSVRNVLALKERFSLLTWRSQDAVLTPQLMNRDIHTPMVVEAAEQSVTLVSDGLSILPIASETPITVFYPLEFDFMGQYFIDGLDPSLVRLVAYPVNPINANIESLTNQVEGTVICLTLDTHRYLGQVELINALLEYPLVVIATQSPYDIQLFPLIQTYLTTFGYSWASMQVAQKIVMGQWVPQGQLPIDLLGE